MNDPQPEKECAVAEPSEFRRPCLVAVWPGMGNVALNAGVYLLAKLQMKEVAEFEAGDLFDIDGVEVKHGILRLGRRPRHRVYLRKDPHQKHDLLLFLGEAQPPLGKYHFCQRLIEYAKQVGVERVFTFAAMGTQMHPEHQSRVFVSATEPVVLDELKSQGVDVLESGTIGGLNGILLGVAEEAGLGGACLLGEMPHIFSQLPFPKASLAILQVFARMLEIELDLSELAEQAEIMEQHLGELLARVEEEYGRPFAGEDQEDYRPGAGEEEDKLSARDKTHIEQLFAEATQDSSKAFELKRELDRLGVFREYEDRFLDLFKKS